MKLFLAVILVAGVAAAKPQGSYTTKYDNINIDDVLKNDRLYKIYFNCLASKGKCAPEGDELKKILPDALKTGCSKCNERQKQETQKVFKFLIEKKPQDFAALEKIYDPQGIYKNKYRSTASQYGVKV